MNRKELGQLWAGVLRSPNSSADQIESLARSVVDVYRADENFKQHIKNRSSRVTETTGQHFDLNSFDVEMARAFIADEIGFRGWNELIESVNDPSSRKYSLLFHYAMAALWRGDFTALDETVGTDAFDEKTIDWYERGYLTAEPETMAELFAAACWLGHVKCAEYLLDKGVDPHAGMRTGLSGFHWAASSGKPDVIKLLIRRKVSPEVKGMYDNTVLGQALWSAINEHTDDHAEVVECLIEGGAHVWPNTLAWWLEQDVPSADSKERIANALRKRESTGIEGRESKD